MSTSYSDPDNSATPDIFQERVRPIPDNFKYNDFTVGLIERNAEIALFQKKRPNHFKSTFEVIILGKHPAETIMGRHYPARETYPPCEAWGSKGWSYTDLESAKRKFEELVRSVKPCSLPSVPDMEMLSAPNRGKGHSKGKGSSAGKGPHE
jgi:hypothetical protein